MILSPLAYLRTSARAWSSETGMPFRRVQVSGLWQYLQRNMQAVVQATRRMPGPSTADPGVKLWRKPRSPVFNALRTSVSGTCSPSLTRISNGEAASNVTVFSGVWLAISFAVERAVDDIHLLLAGQPHEIDRIAGHADRQAGIFFRMIHRVEQRVAVQHVDV